MARNRKKIWLYIIIGVAVPVAFFLWYDRFKTRFIRHTIKQRVAEKTNGLYKISYDSLYLDEISGELIVTNLNVVPDTARFALHKTKADAPSSLLAATISRLHIAGVKTPQALLAREVTGRRIFISDAKVTLYQIKKDSVDEADKEPLQATIYKQVLSKLQLIQVDTISIEHVDFRIVHFFKRREALVASNLSCFLYNVKIDSSTMSDSSRILFSRNIDVHTEKLLLRNRDRRYDYIFRNVQLNSFDQSFQADDIHMKPAYDEVGFMHQLVTQLDRFDFRFQQVRLTRIDFSKLMAPAVVADSLIAGGSSFKLYRDLNLPRDSISRLYHYPQQLIMKLPFDLTIRKAVLKNTFIEYKERNNKTQNSGKVQFYNVYASIDNITNARRSLAANSICTLHFNASFLNKAPLKAVLTMRLGDRQGRFSIKGTLGVLNASDLNALTEPMGLAKMETGQIRQMVFNIRGDNYRGRGSLVLLYDDLKISLLKKGKEDNTYKKKALASFAANIMVINANPLKGKTRDAHIDYKRDLNRSFFNLIWKSIYSGIQQTVGIK